jgi:hypothetical protein
MERTILVPQPKTKAAPRVGPLLFFDSGSGMRTVRFDKSAGKPIWTRFSAPRRGEPQGCGESILVPQPNNKMARLVRAILLFVLDRSNQAIRNAAGRG